MPYNVVVTLPPDRSKSGSIELRDAANNLIAGPFPCLGLADSGAAASHGNAGRTSTLPYGNTPTGTYAIDQIADSSAGTRLGDTRSPSGYLSYGREGVIVLTPVSGDAQARQGIWIHSGDLNSAGELRPTNGCVRVEPGTMTHLRDGIEQLADKNGMCQAIEGTVTIKQVPVAPSTDDTPNDPPPAQYLPPKPRPPKGGRGGGGGLGKPGCFSSGTFVTMADGSRKAIESIEMDDTLLASLDANNLVESVRVSKRLTENSTDVYRLRISSGEVLYITGTQKLASIAGDIVVEDLCIGAPLISSFSQRPLILLEKEEVYSTFLVHYLNVEDDHYYCVGESGLFASSKPKN